MYIGHIYGRKKNIRDNVFPPVILIQPSPWLGCTRSTRRPMLDLPKRCLIQFNVKKVPQLRTDQVNLFEEKKEKFH